MTPRILYTARFIVERVLSAEIEFADTGKGAHILYGGADGNGIRVFPSGLLQQVGISAVKPEIRSEKGKFYLYPAPDSGYDLSLDIFSAVFFCISRYEEWQQFPPDKHGRFEAPASIFFEGQRLLVPWVDRWIAELRAALAARFPELSLPQPELSQLATIDVDNLFAYKRKGIVRTAGGFVKDLLRLDLRGFRERLAVITGRSSDPFDVYSEIVRLCRERGVPLTFFFLYGGRTSFDRTISPSAGIFGNVFRIISNGGAEIGLHPSYDTWKNPSMLGSEKKMLEQHAGSVVTSSRQHYLRFDIRVTPRQLVSARIFADHSMGFASSPGFRAGTAYPFHYFDFETETEQPLLFVPFCVMDGAFTVYGNGGASEAERMLRALYDEVDLTGGLFVTCFHERTFSERLYPGFAGLFRKMISWSAKRTTDE